MNGDGTDLDTLVIRVRLIIRQRRPIGEIGDKAVHVTAFDLFGAFAAAGGDGQKAGQMALQSVQVGKDAADCGLWHVGAEPDQDDVADHGSGSLVGADHVGGFFRDHDGGGIGVGRDDARHDRRVNDAQPRDAVEA